MLYITKVNIKEKTARAKHLLSLIQASSKSDLGIIFKHRTNETKTRFLIQVIRLLLKSRNKKVYTRDLDIAFLLYLMRRQGTYEVHQFGCLRTTTKLYKLKRCIVRCLVKSNIINLVVLTPGSEKLIRRLYKKDVKGTVTVIQDASPKTDLIKFNSTKQNKISEISIGYAGSFLPGKGGCEAIELANKIPGYKFKLAGPLLNDTMISIKEANNIVYYGNLNKENLDDFYLNCDILIAPIAKRIFLDRECNNEITFFTSPLKIYEYLSKYKPIITTRRPCTFSIENQPGVWVIEKEKANNISEWERVIEEVIKDKSFRNDILLRDQRQEKLYTWDMRLKEMANLK